MCLHSKVHRSMLLVSLRYFQYSMCRVTNFKVHYATLLLLCGKVRYAMLTLLLHSKMQSNSSMPLVVVYHALFSRSNVLF